MTVEVGTINNSGDYPSTDYCVFMNVWEIQDNDGTYIVIKFHNHECELIEKSKLKKLEVKLNG